MSFDLTAEGALVAMAAALGAALLLIGIAWLVTWVLSHRD
jgi:uncharacterized iron-regulated membrane protein